MGLIRADFEALLQAYTTWQTRVFSGTNIKLNQLNIEDNIDNIIMKLSPLTTPIPTKSVFIKTHSEWVAYFDNGRNGTDPAGVLTVLSGELKCPSRLISAISAPVSKAASHFRYPGTRIDYYNEFGECSRCISAINDGGSWVFDQCGDALAFEQTENYLKRKIKDRLTVEMIEKYLKSEGLYPFKSDWFRREARLFKLSGGYLPSKVVEYPLVKDR